MQRWLCLAAVLMLVGHARGQCGYCDLVAICRDVRDNICGSCVQYASPRPARPSPLAFSLFPLISVTLGRLPVCCAAGHYKYSTLHWERLSGNTVRFTLVWTCGVTC